MTNRVKVVAKDEKQAIISASKKLHVDVTKLKANLVKEGRKILFGMFKNLSEYEVTYDLCENISKEISSHKKDDFSFEHDISYNYSPYVKYNKIEDIPDEDMRKKATIACQYLDSILALLDVGEIKKDIEFGGNNNLKIKLSGENVAIVIGRFGEVLDAIQYLVVLSANRDGGRYMKVILDSQDFRKNRKKSLQQLSKKIANKAIISRKMISLEPMNPYERRVIHSCIYKIEGVYSKSVGVDPNRRVVVYPEGGFEENLYYKKPNKKTYTSKNSKNISSSDKDLYKDHKFSAYSFEKEFLKSDKNEKMEYGKVNL